MGQKKVLITGATGLLGGRLCQHLLRTSHLKIVLAQRSDISLAPFEDPKTAHVDLETRYFDLTDEESIKNICRDIDIVFHLAASNAPTCEQDQFAGFQTNVVGTRHLIDSAIAHSVEQFVFISTIHVYGEASRLLEENSKCFPKTNYSRFKLLSEEHLEAAVRGSKLNATVIRLSNAIGYPISKKVNCWHLIANDLVRQGVCKRSLQLKSDPLIRRDFLAIRDACEVIAGFLTLSGRERFEIFNLTSGVSRPLSWLVELIATRLDHHGQIYKNEVPMPCSKQLKEYAKEAIFSNAKLLTRLKRDPFAVDAFAEEMDELIQRTSTWFDTQDPERIDTN